MADPIAPALRPLSRASSLWLIGALACALLVPWLPVPGERIPEAVAADPPTAVQEYDFGGSGPVGDLRWGGRTVAIDISPADKNVALVAASTGGLWRTADGGLTWSHVDGFPMFFPHDVKYDPNDQNIVFATTDDDQRTTTQAGIWRSTDAGTTWSRTSAPFPCSSQPVAWSIGTVAGADTHTKVFVANDCGVAYSNDSGTTWANVDPSGGAPSKFVGVAAVRTGAGSAVAYACSAVGVYRATVSGNGAPIWTAVSTAPQVSGSNWCQIAISPLDSNVVFVTTGTPKPYELDIDSSAIPATVIVTELAGPPSGDGARPPSVLTHRAVDGDAAHFDLYFSNGQKFYRQHCTNDGDPSTVDCGAGAETGAQCTNAVDDDGDQMVNEGCPKVGADPENDELMPSQCKGALDEDGDGVVNDGCPVMEHFDNGTHVDPNDIAFDPTVPGGTGCAVLTTNDGGVGRSTDCGATWADSNAGLRALQIYNVWGTLRGTGATDTDIYFGTHDNEWWYSLDNGGTWAKAFCCEGFLGQADYRIPSGGLSNIRLVFVNCAGCGSGTSARGFASPTGWPNPPGGAWGTDGLAAAPIMFGHEMYVQVGSDMRSPPSFRLYVMKPEAGAQCSNSLDDDGDGIVNDGCPADASPETGAQCHNGIDDDDGGSGLVNEGCSGIFSPESGSECTNATDDDSDGVVNDGCARIGGLPETGTACMDAVDANEDGVPDGVNDGCPQVGVWGQMGPSFTQRPNRAPIVASGPATGPTFYFGVEAAAGTWKLRKMTGPMDPTATLSDASGSGASSLNALQQAGNQFYYPLVFAADPQNPAHLYAADSGSSQMRSSVDGGITWQVDPELTALVTDYGKSKFLPWRIVYDPEDSQRILVGTHSTGIIASVNGGQDWFRLQGSEQIPMVTSFFFDRDHDVIYATSFGRGLWTVTLPEADLSVTKVDTPDPATAGDELFYTVTVSNSGPQTATVEVVDTLPPEVRFIDDNLPPPLGCAEAPVGTLTCAVGVLDAGRSTSFQVKVAVTPDAVASGGPKAILNSVSVRSTDTTDPDTTDDTAFQSTFVEDRADLAVTKLCKPDTTVLAGNPIDCSVFVDNLGPSTARAVIVDDTMLANGSFTVSSISPALGGGTPGCTLTAVTGGQELSCRLGNLDPQSSTSTGRAVMTYRITSTEGMDINNQAVVRSDTPDPVGGNNTAIVPLTITAVADMAIVKTAPASVNAGTNLTWTLNVTNSGPSMASNVFVRDVIPPGVDYISASVTSGSGSCTAGVPGDADQPVTCGLGTMTSGATRTIQVTVKVRPHTTGILGNDASVRADTFDPNSANDVSHSDTTVNVVIGLELTMVGSPDPVASGTVLTYRSTALNNGPSTATSVVLDLVLPPDTTYDKSTLPGGGSCGLLTVADLRCVLPNLGPGRSVDVFIDVLVAAKVESGTTLIAAGSLSAASGTPANSSAMVSANRVSDLAVVLTSDVTKYKPSKIIHYSVVMANNGPSDASGVTFTLNLPPPKTAIYNSNDGGCPAPVGSTMTCDIGILRAAETKTVMVNVLIRGNKGTITSWVSVISNGAVGSPASSDPVAANNSSTRVVTVK